MEKGKEGSSWASYLGNDQSTEFEEFQNRTTHKGRFIGRRVRCFVSVYDRYYSGTIESCNPERFSYKVKYDDGAEEEVFLPDPTIHILPDTRGPSGSHSQPAEPTQLEKELVNIAHEVRSIANQLPSAVVRCKEYDLWMA
eukprot:CAMPEP_0118950588 /NCGR_PEP_ID=MMETSP1169-20130426/51664_1 /TAXON_ID=36882 /ORGANISM="Pyramimonas obovata, Strain CCMP722" /LENGTH=139 /DNA_ID=CAMNT_0006897467 /DNA_START=45 /DNA_END=460 /DNA_ORIENTATION=+